MKIAAAQLNLQSSHQLITEHTQSESLRAWVGRQPSAAPSSSPASSQDGVVVNLSRQGPLKLNANTGNKPAGNFSAQGEFLAAPVSNDSLEASNPHLSLIRALLEKLFGQKIDVFEATASTDQANNPSTPAPATSGEASPPPPNAGWGVAYDYQESYSEHESTSFSVSGKVQTSDGRQIDFNLSLRMERSYTEQSSIRIRAGDAVQAQDPLVLNFDGTAPQLSDWRFNFDLNADGTTESIPFIGPGQGVLAFDRNGNGRIDNGSELFGPTTGNGFAELAALDSDDNGWIDENDNAFNNLRIWSKSSADQEQVQTLMERGVGALSLTSQDTPFALRNSQNQSLGDVRQSGLFLQEDGKAGTMQQVDVAV